MKFTLKINEISSLTEIPGYWTHEDYITLLEELEFPDAKNSDPAELLELLHMALSDFEPDESAEILLRYKLKDKLSRGQIQNLSQEMLDDNEAEHNADISLHYPLFSINQLLASAFKGVFPAAKATKLEIELRLKDSPQKTVSKEFVLKAMCCGLTDNSPIHRLFEEQLQGTEPFTDAEYIIWEVHPLGGDAYSILTSDYWISKDDIVERECSGSILLYEEDED